ncbi:MAG: hypothetical protein ACT4PV_00430 [Planctomycetaceae bacterium]
MRSHIDRINMIENLMSLLQQMELDPESSLRRETELLSAYALTQIERHLSELKSGSRSLAP